MFLLFGFSTYYPSGGMGDFLGAFKSRDDAYNAYINHRKEFDDGQIVDLSKDLEDWEELGPKDKTNSFSFKHELDINDEPKLKSSRYTGYGDE